MGNLACQKIDTSPTPQLTPALSPQSTQNLPQFNPTESLALRPVSLNNTSTLSMKSPRLSLHNKSYFIDVLSRDKKNSQTPMNQTVQNKSCNGSLKHKSVMEIEQPEDKKRKSTNNPLHRRTLSKQSNVNNRSTISNSKLPVRVEEFLHKQVALEEKRKKSIERLREQRKLEQLKENSYHPLINEKSHKIVERKYSVLRGKKRANIQEPIKDLQQQKPLNKNFTFDGAPSQPQTTVNPTTTTKQKLSLSKNGYQTNRNLNPASSSSFMPSIQQKLLDCLKNLGLSINDTISFLLFMIIMKELKMISQNHWTLETLPAEEKELLQEAWAVFKEPSEEYARAGRVLEFLMRVVEKGDGKENEIRERFGYFRRHRERFIMQESNVETHANKVVRNINRSPVKNHLSLLSQKTMVQIEVNLGSCVKTIKIDKSNSIEQAAKNFVIENGLNQQAEGQLIKLIRNALK